VAQVRPEAPPGKWFPYDSTEDTKQEEVRLWAVEEGTGATEEGPEATPRVAVGALVGVEPVAEPVAGTTSASA
jgi:hypothetical protein